MDKLKPLVSFIYSDVLIIKGDLARAKAPVNAFASVQEVNPLYMEISTYE